MFKDPIVYRVKTINNLMKRNIDIALMQKLDKATFMRCWIIGFIHERNERGLDTFQKEIEKEFNISRSTTSEMLKMMEKKQLIKRESVDYDARLKKITLTSYSQTIDKIVDSEAKRIHESITNELTQEELDTYLKISDKIINNLKNLSNHD